jgi:hypothetical protein
MSPGIDRAVSRRRREEAFMESRVYEVGQAFDPSRTTWPETVRYSYRDGQHELVAFRRRPSMAEIEALTEGPSEFALYVDGDLLLFLFRFQSLELDPVIDWSDSPFTIHRVPESERQLPPDVPGRGQLHVLLVDAGTGLVIGARIVTLDEAFTTALHGAIREQAARPSSADYDRALRQIYASHRTAALARLAQYRSRGT